MAFEEIKENIAGLDINMRSYVDRSAEYYRLRGFKFLMKGITSLSKVLLVASLGLIALLFLSLAASFGIGQAMNNTFYGFLCVGGFYLLVGILAYAMRNRLNKPILKKFSEFYFEE